MKTPPDECDSWQQLYPFTGHWCEVAGGRMHYLDEGPENAEQTLLFVHGNPTWSFHWRRLIEANRDSYRCIAPDHIGCGLSDLQKRPLRLADHIQNLSELVRNLDLCRVTLVAQDWGGAIGLGTLLKERDLFERIVLFNTGAFRPWFIPWRIRVCRWPLFGKLALQGGNAFSLASLRMTLSRTTRLDPAVAEAYLAPYNSWTRRAAVHQFVKDIPLSASHPTWDTLGEIEDALPSLAGLPQLLIWGMQDWCFTPECLEKFCQVWPKAEVHRLADVGHWVVEDAPEESQRFLADFLARTAEAATGANR
ncbi:alpha/beta fold hydrolase [Bythopirellula goksoeyrii]|uniref:alpha/beta fold hydrolase n=1 Tax=Bythopirellula goksoeyrii TaxID=1400387 RepID=UPI001EE5FF0D|nr:alpha/beta fold hydrolase [Bythopirellula goksoeyrii]